ncbi:MAG: FkbM family methyltransferase [Flavobacterium sp.]|nr:MAG: FkbM family methyltransferase [Flavobacterium sp.]
MKKLLRSLIPSNYKQDIKDQLGVPSLSALLKQLKARGYKPSVVYDIGAYEGHWALDFHKIFDSVPIFMFEAQQNKEHILKALCGKLPVLHYAIALLGATAGQAVQFEENETASHVNATNQEEKTNRVTDTLDSLIEKNKFPLPDFLKLDVQGYELEILKGGQKALTNAEFCLLEVSLLDVGAGGVPLLKDVIDFMDAKGFCAYDISQFIRRPYDKALWQIDMLFVKKASRFIEDKRWA